MLKTGALYDDLGSHHFDKRGKGKQIHRLVSRLQNLGFAVQITPVPAVAYCLRHYPAAAASARLIDRQTAAKAGAVPPALFPLSWVVRRPFPGAFMRAQRVAA